MPDPNADLIGYEFDVEDGRARVLGTSVNCGSLYVEVEVTPKVWLAPIYKTVRPSGLVRDAKEAAWSS
jgi:hypothetical protein